MPTRQSTARVYRAFLHNHILPKWGAVNIRELRPRPIELWLRDLALAPKSKTHVRSLLYGIVKYAMWAGLLELNINPVSLVKNTGATKKVRKPRSLTAAEFHDLLSELREPHSSIALLCVCLGLRFSECLALQWQDVDWLGSRLHIRRGIVNQVVGSVNTVNSEKALNLAPEVLERLKAHRSSTEFPEPSDWVFASPLKLGRLPYSYTGVCVELSRGAKASGLGHLGTHTYRHTYRSWLDAVGTPIAVQQKMMRHADIRTTMNIYGDVVTDEMENAGIRVAGIAFRAQTERMAS